MKRRTKNRILKTITVTAVILAVLSACCVDSESNIPIIVLMISAAWLFLFCLANGEE